MIDHAGEIARAEAVVDVHDGHTACAGIEHAQQRRGRRVIYVDIFEKEKLYFLFAYPKNVQVNLTEQQKKIVRQMVEAIKGE